MKLQKKILATLAVVLVSSILSAGSSADCTPDPDRRNLRVHTSPQKEENWCWAAVGEMIMEYVGKADGFAVTQCQLADTALRRSDCCGNSDRCDVTGYPPFEKCGFKADFVEGRGLSWDDIREQIDCNQSPISTIYNFPDWAVEHIVVISGYKRDGENFVLQRDPAPRNKGTIGWETFDEYKGSPDKVHLSDYKNIIKLP